MSADPRYRPFRGAAWALYLTFSVSFSSLIIYSVFKSVLAMTPESPAIALPPLPEAECLAQARTLFSELERQRQQLGNSDDVSHGDQRFLTFRVEWMRKKRLLDPQCTGEGHAASSQALSSLDRLVDLYTTASVQFAGGVGPQVDELKKLLGN